MLAPNRTADSCSTMVGGVWQHSDCANDLFFLQAQLFVAIRMHAGYLVWSRVYNAIDAYHSIKTLDVQLLH